MKMTRDLQPIGWLYEKNCVNLSFNSIEVTKSVYEIEIQFSNSKNKFNRIARNNTIKGKMLVSS